VPALLGPNRSSSGGLPKGYNVLVTKSGHQIYGIPAGTELVRLTSNPTLVGADLRRLGAAITKITVDGCEIPITDPSLFQGFHPIENEGERSWRWTDGAATVP